MAELTAEAGTQAAGLGTYCWSEDGQGLCVDFIGTPIPDQALAVDMGETVTISVPGIQQIANVSVAIYDFADTELSDGTRMLLFPLPEPIEAPFEDDGAIITLTADLPPGDYAVTMFVSFPGETSASGDAQYGFHIEVS